MKKENAIWQLLVACVALFSLLALMLILQHGTSFAGVSHAPLLSSKSDCQAAGGSWSGISNDEGACTYAANSGAAIQACGANHTYLVVFDIDLVKTTFCQALHAASFGTDSTQREPAPDPGGKCKLIEIESNLSLGGTFRASWTGLMQSIRFRQAGAGLQFISMIPGTLSYEQIHPGHDHLHRSAEFSNAFLLDRGRWEASCWGTEGTFGTPLIINVN